jgi:hypothetical protein
VDDLQKQIKKIQAHFPQIQDIPTTISDLHDAHALAEKYAELLKDSADLATAPAKKLVTDLLIRCIIWAELIQQQYVYSMLTLALAINQRQTRQNRREIPRTIRQVEDNQR